MLRKTLDCILEETIPLPVLEVSDHRPLSEAVVVVPKPPLKISKASVRTSLRASTLDGVFATIFSSATTGILLTNFLLGLGATSVEIGFLSSIPMFVNLLPAKLPALVKSPTILIQVVGLTNRSK